jgi:hypothetical protein
MKYSPEVIESLKALKADSEQILQEAEADNDTLSAEMSKHTIADIDEVLSDPDNQ